MDDINNEKINLLLKKYYEKESTFDSCKFAKMMGFSVLTQTMESNYGNIVTFGNNDNMNIIAVNMSLSYTDRNYVILYMLGLYNFYSLKNMDSLIPVSNLDDQNAALFARSLLLPEKDFLNKLKNDNLSFYLKNIPKHVIEDRIHDYDCKIKIKK